MAGNPTPPDYELADRIALTAAGPGQGARPSPAQHDPGPAPRAGRDGDRAGDRARAAEEHGRPPRQGAHRGRTAAGRQDAPGAGDRGALLRPHGPHVLRRRSSGAPEGEELPRDFNDFEVAAGESAAAFRDGKLWGFIRHARISEAQASEFWERMADLVEEFDRLPRSGDTMYGFALGVYPTDQPTLPSTGD